MKTKNEELASVAERLAGHLDAIRVHGRRKVKAAWEAGRELLAAKELVGHGGWIRWLKNQGLASTTAERYMLLAKCEIHQFGDFDSLTEAYEQCRRREGGGGKTTYQTPSAIVERVRNAMGGIDLDPLSSAEANKTVRARTYYTSADDGFSKEWTGRVFLNPPFTASVMARTVAKLLSSPNVTQAIVLTDNVADTSYGQRLLNAATAYCHTNGRISFTGDGKSSLRGQTIHGYRVDVDRFHEAFATVGHVGCSYEVAFGRLKEAA